MSDHVADGSYISPEQLCVGLYIHLDLPWSAHPFTFSSFKLRKPEQVDAVRQLGLPRIRYSPERSDVQPAVAPAPTRAPEVATAPSAEALATREEHQRRLQAQRARMSACERQLASAAGMVRGFNQRVFSQPQQVRADADHLISGLASSMLVEADVSLQLMADKIGGEDVYSHGLNVALLGMMVARQLQAPPAVVQGVGLAALFHDLGELEVPDKIRRKTEPWTRAEQQIMQQHVEHGVQLGRKLGLPADALQAMAQHHERADGSGYPAGVPLAQLPLISRILAVVDTFDEACNPTIVSRSLTAHEALSAMFSQHSAQFDPLVLNTFVRCMGVYPPGTVVQLSSGQRAMVVSVNTTKPLRPVVLVHDPLVPKHEALVCDLEHTPEVSVVQALRPEQLSDAERHYLAPRVRTTYFLDADAGAALSP